MGFLDALSGLCGCPEAPLAHRHLQKGRQLETVEMKVKIDCEGCENKIRKTLEGMDGVTGIEVVPGQNRVTVTGYVDAAQVMSRVARMTGKRVESWPYVPYGTYDKKPPAGYVRDVAASHGGASSTTSRSLGRASSTETRCTGAFSDEKANSACGVI